MIQPLADYGGGSATGSMYLHEPGFPGTTGDCLYTCDWARGIFYRHELTRKGASYTVTQEQFVKGVSPTDIDTDGCGRMYLADWDRRGWGSTEGPIGTIYLIEPTTNLA